MATKIFCDRCKKETRYRMQGVRPHDNDRVAVTTSEGDTSTFDLCGECWSLVVSFIRYPKDGNWKVLVK